MDREYPQILSKVLILKLIMDKKQNCDTDAPLKAEQSIVSCLGVDQLWISVLAMIYWRTEFCWWPQVIWSPFNTMSILQNNRSRSSFQGSTIIDEREGGRARGRRWQRNCLLNTMGQLYIWTPSGCCSMHKTFVSWSQKKVPAWRREVDRKPRPDDQPLVIGEGHFHVLPSSPVMCSLLF